AGVDPEEPAPIDPAELGLKRSADLARLHRIAEEHARDQRRLPDAADQHRRLGFDPKPGQLKTRPTVDRGRGEVARDDLYGIDGRRRREREVFRGHVVLLPAVGGERAELEGGLVRGPSSLAGRRIAPIEEREGDRVDACRRFEVDRPRAVLSYSG